MPKLQKLPGWLYRVCATTHTTAWSSRQTGPWHSIIQQQVSNQKMQVRLENRSQAASQSWPNNNTQEGTPHVEEAQQSQAPIPPSRPRPGPLPNPNLKCVLGSLAHSPEHIQHRDSFRLRPALGSGWPRPLSDGPE